MHNIMCTVAIISDVLIWGGCGVPETPDANGKAKRQFNAR